jgi:ppGpp synthetase/RelA/SpoT-type nucleotidyltranferase
MHFSMPQHKSPDIATVPFILALLGTTEQALQEQELAPQTLAEIYNDYLSRQPELTDIAQFVAGLLLRVEGVHAVNYRVKAPLHLLQKIIRKKKEYPDRVFTQDSYLDLINDLAGVRALHLYKDSWIDISRYIQQEWKLKRTPYAYINKQEDALLLQDFAAHGCKVIPHPAGYKAMHFVIETKPGKQRYFAEIQLRTLFEESWSEIDHSIRYPDHFCSKLSENLLTILNRLTSDADEMATFIKALSDKMLIPAPEQPSARWTAEERTQLQAQVEKLPLTNEEKQRLLTLLQRMFE